MDRDRDNLTITHKPHPGVFFIRCSFFGFCLSGNPDLPCTHLLKGQAFLLPARVTLLPCLASNTELPASGLALPCKSKLSLPLCPDIAYWWHQPRSRANSGGSQSTRLFDFPWPAGTVWGPSVCPSSFLLGQEPPSSGLLKESRQLALACSLKASVGWPLSSFAHQASS